MNTGRWMGHQAMAKCKVCTESTRSAFVCGPGSGMGQTGMSSALERRKRSARGVGNTLPASLASGDGLNETTVRLRGGTEAFVPAKHSIKPPMGTRNNRSAIRRARLSSRKSKGWARRSLCTQPPCQYGSPVEPQVCLHPKRRSLPPMRTEAGATPTE
eukprot:scaffold316_cov352-Pavlova_lutheri.AAC.38